jgi:hypothetical protein
MRGCSLDSYAQKYSVEICGAEYNFVAVLFCEGMSAAA